jgi:hypothetical protein
VASTFDVVCTLYCIPTNRRIFSNHPALKWKERLLDALHKYAAMRANNPCAVSEGQVHRTVLDQSGIVCDHALLRFLKSYRFQIEEDASVVLEKIRQDYPGSHRVGITTKHGQHPAMGKWAPVFALLYNRKGTPQQCLVQRAIAMPR